MQRIEAKSPQAKRAYQLVVSLQHRLVEKLQAVSESNHSAHEFEPIEWFRSNGQHGGGIRYVAHDKATFNQASVNVSQVQYDSDDTKALASATALSSIVHPYNPLAPSVHMHVSWTEMKTGHGYWRVMADLNPAIENPQHTVLFREAIDVAAREGLGDEQLTAALARGDRYFYIPALERHRGVCHFYLENYFTDDTEADIVFSEHVMNQVIDAYTSLLLGTVQDNSPSQPDDFKQQLDYHSLYFFQVLTLDRGTTSGLLVHNQNDVGILGSLPTAVDKQLIASWRANMPSPQEKLLDGLLDCLPAPDSAKDGHSVIDDKVKSALANTVRNHYKKHPEALALQASGDVIPPTVANHR